MGPNAQIRRFRNTVLQLINAEPLPVEVKRLVLSEIMQAVSNKCDEEIQRESKEDQQNEQSIQPDNLAE